MERRRKARVAAVWAVVLVVALAATGYERLTARGARQALSVETEIVYPTAGGEVAGPNVLVQFSAPTQTADGQAVHVDLLVDGDATRLERVTNPAIVPRLGPGEHTVTLEVQDESEQPIAGAESPSVTFTVLQTLPVRLQAGPCNRLQGDPVAVLNPVESGYRTTSAPAGETAEEGEQAATLPLGAEQFKLVEVSETLLELPIAVLLGETHSLVVYAPGAEYDGEIERDEKIACGEIGGPAYQNEIRVALEPLYRTGAFGVAVLRDEQDRTRIRIEFYRNDIEPVATPSPTPTATAVATLPPPTVIPPEIPTEAPTEIPIDTPVPPPPPNTPIPPPPPTNTPVPQPTATTAPTATLVPTATEPLPPTEPPTVPPPTEPPPTEPPPTEAPTNTPVPTDTPGVAMRSV